MTDTATDMRNQLYGLLGDLPPRGRPIDRVSHGRELRGAYTLELET
jgi:hypothetical protein